MKRASHTEFLTSPFLMIANCAVPVAFLPYGGGYSGTSETQSPFISPEQGSRGTAQSSAVPPCYDAGRTPTAFPRFMKRPEFACTNCSTDWLNLRAGLLLATSFTPARRRKPI